MSIIDFYQLNAIVMPIAIGLFVTLVVYEVGCDVCGL